METETLLIIFFTTHKKFCNFEIQFFVNIPGFIRPDLKHQGELPDAVSPLMKVFSGKQVKARVFLKYWRKILRLEKYCWIVVERATTLIP